MGLDDGTLDFPGEWLFEDITQILPIPKSALAELEGILDKIADAAPSKYKALELFKDAFGAPYPSSNESWAISDLHVVFNRERNAVEFLSAYWKAIHLAKQEGWKVPSDEKINRVLASNNVPYKLAPPKLIAIGKNPVATVTIAEANLERQLSTDGEILRNWVELVNVVRTDWYGRLSELEFLGRLFNLKDLPSTDPRYKTMADDVYIHRVANEGDWPDDWIFDDPRLNLQSGVVFLKFLAETVHPEVLADASVRDFRIQQINALLAVDGWTLSSLGNPQRVGPIATEANHGVAPRLGPLRMPIPQSRTGRFPGSEVGYWMLGRCIGAGGFGDVYEATHELIQLKAAVKIVNTGGRTGVERFRREAACLGRLQHSGIPLVFDAGFVYNEEYAFIAQELLVGSDLEQLLRHSDKEQSWRPAEDEVFEVVRQMSEILAVAHVNGVVHRDVKPANIFLAEKEGKRTVKLLDFGIAKQQDQPKLTDTGLLVGTELYLAPEVFDGKTGTPSRDVWALGVTAYELITQRLPFQTIAQIVTGTYERLDRGRYPLLSPIVDACLAMSPQDRPHDGKQLTNLVLTTK